MKRVLVLFGLAVIVAIVLFVLLLGQASDSNTLIVNEDPATETDTSASRQPADVDVLDSISELTHPPVPADARPARVTRLADGDSFEIEWADTGEPDEVRLFGINAPETSACFGGIARDILFILTDAQELQIETIERDEFGRVLANVWTGPLLVNLELVESGAAVALSDGGAHAGLIQDAMEIAQVAEAGLWDPDACGATSESLRIAAIEADAPGQDNFNPNGEWIEIVNDGDVDAVLSDWSIRDESTRHRYFFPDGFVLRAGTTVRIFSGCGDDRADELYWCDGDPVWNNGGDTGFLVDPEGRFADTLSYDG